MSLFKRFWPKPEEADTVRAYVPPVEEPYYSKDENIKCKYGHAISGIKPGVLEIENDGKLCDCGNIRFVAENCGCENNPHLELRERQS